VHEAITRLLHRLEPSTEQLRQEAQSQVCLSQGILVVDDSTLDKLYAKKMELVTRPWSGKHGRVVQGINLITLLWREGDRHTPLDYQFYEKCVDGATKNDIVKGYSLVKVFKIVAPNGDIDYWATNDLEMGELQRLQFAEFG
jgi:hypothetical protein